VCSVLIAVTLTAAAGGLATGCGPKSSDDQWAAVMVDTCRSIVARARLRNPTPEELNAQRFLDERRRLLASGRTFNTVSAFRNVCGAVRDEITGKSTPTTTLGGISDDPAVARTLP